LVPVVESRLWEGTATLPEAGIRQRVCRGPECGIIFYICRSCDRGQCYCSEYCRHQARLAQRRKANREYQASFAAMLDHAAHQQAYRQRQKLKLKKVTGQGSETSTPSVTIDSALIITGFVTKNPEQQARQAPYAEPKPFWVCQKANSRLVSCIICGRSMLWTVPFPRSP
jgi:hypothetical protein